MEVFHKSYSLVLGKILLNLLTSTPSVLHVPLLPSDSLPDSLLRRIHVGHLPEPTPPPASA